MSQLERDKVDVKALNDIDDGLSDWEVSFAESLQRWVDSSKTLTPKQRETLEKILERFD